MIAAAPRSGGGVDPSYDDESDLQTDPANEVGLDGPAGAGKPTTARHLAHHLSFLGYDVHATTQPSRGRLGEIARHHTETYRGLSLACLVAADRYDHLDADLRPHRAAGRVVICDRYVASSYVPQRIDGVLLDFVEALNAHADRPDLAVPLTADPHVTAARVVRRGAHDRFHNGIESTQREIELYQDSGTRLAAKGWPVVKIDTTNRSTRCRRRIHRRVGNTPAGYARRPLGDRVACPVSLDHNRTGIHRMSDRHIIDVHVLLVRGDELLLIERRGSYGGGMWHLPSGKLDADESVLAAAVREAREEVGVHVEPDDLRHVHTVHVAGSGPVPRLGMFFEARNWVGEPVNREPEKCSAVEWFPVDALPDDVIPYPLAGIRAYLDGTTFDVLGWDDNAPIAAMA